MDNKVVERYITGFRVATLFFATLLFLRYNQNEQIATNMTIIGCLIVSCIIMIYFTYNEKKESNMLIAVMLETIGLGFVLINSNCYYSYYFWLLLNPLLVAINKLSGKRRAGFILFNCLLIVMLSVFAYSRDQVVEVSGAHIIFGFLAVLSFAIVIMKIMEQLKLTLIQLENTNLHLTESLNSNKAFADNLVDSTDFIDQLTHVEDFDQSLGILKDHLIKWEIATKKFLIIITDTSADARLSMNISDSLIDYIISISNVLEFNNTVEGCTIGDEHLLITKSYFDQKIILFGIITSEGQTLNGYDFNQQLLFIRRQFNVQSSRLKLLKFKEELVISEEQNRIAEEIHDQVNQQIFAASCLAYNIENHINENENEKIEKQVHKLYEILKCTNKELKNIVYRMSQNKNSHFSQVSKLKSYLNDLSIIYDIEVESLIMGNFDELDNILKYNMFRIMNEAIANAVKHGRCNKVRIIVKEIETDIVLEITDNGSGFETESRNRANCGIGLINMERISKKYDGKFDVSSTLGEGTTIRLVI